MKGKKSQGRCSLPMSLKSIHATQWHAPSFTVQGLRDALTEAESAATGPLRTLQMNSSFNWKWLWWIDLGRPHPPAFSWNRRHGATCAEGRSSFEGFGTCAGGWPRAHVFILLWPAWISQSLQRGRPYPSIHTLQMPFAEWIRRSTHFDAVPLLLEAGRQCTWQLCRKGTGNVFGPQSNLLYLCTWANLLGSGSSQLVGGVPPIPEAQEGVAEQETPRANAARPHRWQTKARPAPGGGGGVGGGSPPSSPEYPGGADSDDYLTWLVNLVKVTGA